MFRLIAHELKEHVPFTALGTITGIIIIVIVVSSHASSRISEDSFYILHPLHVAFSAIVIASMYKRYSRGKVWAMVLVGYTGSVGLATLSDSLIPYVGEVLLNLPNPGFHIGFMEKWWLVNPMALIGIAIGYWRPTTKFPHAAHVLVSTWASLFHMTMALGETFSWILLPLIAVFLFLAVWIPCCTGDIVYPLLFIRKAKELPSPYLVHSHEDQAANLS